MVLPLLLLIAPAAGAQIVQVQSLEHDDTGQVRFNTFVQVDADTYALAYMVQSADDSIKTFTISADGNTITQVQSVSPTGGGIGKGTLFPVDADTYVHAHGLTDGWMETFTIPASGATITQVQSVTFGTEQTSHHSFAQVDADTFVLAHWAHASIGLISTFTIPASGSTITEVHTLNHRSTNPGSDNSLVQVDADTFLLAFGGSTAGWLKTFTIPASGSTITEVQSLNHDTSQGLDNSLVQVDADTYALAYQGAGNDGFIKTFTVPASGSTITQVQSFEHDTLNGSHNSFIKVGPDTFALAYAGDGDDGFIKIFTISDDGTTITQDHSLEHDTDYAIHNSLVQVDSDTLALAYSSTNDDGFIKTFNFTPAATPPGFSKVFSPATIVPGGTSTLTFTINNTANGSNTTSLAFTDTLPADVEVAATPAASKTCTGGTITATAASNVISYSGGTVSDSSSCTVQADVTAPTAGSKVNTSSTLTSSAGTSPAATDTLTVQNLTVDSTGDTGDTSAGDSACIATGGGCTLRAAIQEANAHAGAQVIEFAIGSGAQTITLGSVLPGITGDLVIDGSSQPGFAGTNLITVDANSLSNPLSVSSAAVTLQNFDVSGAGGTALNLNNADGSTIDGLDLSDGGAAFAVDTGILATNCDDLTIQNCEITNREDGIQVTGGSDVQVLDTDLSGSGNVLNSGKWALGLWSVGSTSLPGGILVSGNTFTGCGRAVSISSMSGLTISDGSVGGSHVILEDDSGITSSNNALWLGDVDNSTVDSIDLSDATPAHAGSGLRLEGCDNATLQNLTIRNRTTAVAIHSSATVGVSCSAILDNTTGVAIGSTPTGVQLVNNHFQRNTTAVASGAAALVDAENNFWGTADGSASDSGTGDTQTARATSRQRA